MRRIILASSSARRKELLSWLGVKFVTIASEFDESLIDDDDPEELVQTLAVEKAKRVAEKIVIGEIEGIDDGVVIGADTVVVLGEKSDEIIGKPMNSEEAFEMLSKLRGRDHWVYTGVAVIDTATGEVLSEYEATKVSLRNVSDEELWDHIGRGGVLDKAGGYAIQENGREFVTGIEGSYTNVVGLPLVKLAGMLEDAGIRIDRDVETTVWEKVRHRN